MTLVAMITWCRLLRAVIHIPSTVSDSPPELRGAHREYTSAVSMKFPPAAQYASSTASDACWSVVQPNVLPPRQRAATFNPVRPSLRISTVALLRGSMVHSHVGGSNGRLAHGVIVAQRVPTTSRRPLRLVAQGDFGDLRPPGAAP